MGDLALWIAGVQFTVTMHRRWASGKSDDINSCGSTLQSSGDSTKIDDDLLLTIFNLGRIMFMLQ